MFAQHIFLSYREDPASKGMGNPGLVSMLTTSGEWPVRRTGATIVASRSFG